VTGQSHAVQAMGRSYNPRGAGRAAVPVAAAGGADAESAERAATLAGRVRFNAAPRACWAVAKLVRHQALDLAFEGSNPSRPAPVLSCA
jgi:hypothetical protein